MEYNLQQVDIYQIDRDTLQILFIQIYLWDYVHDWEGKDDTLCKMGASACRYVGRWMKSRTDK